MYWVRYINTLKITDRWDVVSDVDIRGNLLTGFPRQSMLPRIEARYNLKNGYSVSVGMAALLTFRTSASDLESIEAIAPELRPHIAFTKRDKLGRLTIQQRLRFEQRFFAPPGTSIDYSDEWPMQTRFRYQLMLNVPIMMKDGTELLVLNVGDEVMVHAGEDIGTDVFEQNRVLTGFSLSLRKNLILDMTHIWWLQVQGRGAFMNRNVLQVGLRHTIDLTQKKEREVTR